MASRWRKAVERDGQQMEAGGGVASRDFRRWRGEHGKMASRWRGSRDGENKQR